MSIRVLATDQHVINMYLRMPFRFGIATLTALPHLFLRAEVEVNGRRVWGVAADHLALKWFTKNPETHVRDDLLEMHKIIDSACAIACSTGSHKTVFDWWLHAYQGQAAWGGGWGYPPLLSNFGASLVERAVIDAFCRAGGTSFAESVHGNDFGIRLGQLQPELEQAKPADFLPAAPLRSLIARHTVGLTDPLTEQDIAPADRVNDGLPHSLEACIRAYGLTHFKIKLWGDAGKDLDRLSQIAGVLERETGGPYALTLDGNENFKSVECFRGLWSRLIAEPALKQLLASLLFVEQPIHRDLAMTPEVGRALTGWPQRPPMIIDESDGAVATGREALSLGYSGTSHKNCKGIFKGLANACLIEHRRRQDRTVGYVMSAEDLSTVGPVSLQQDLAVVATLGIPHVERNGHHYFKGLSMLPPPMQEATAAAYPDLYQRDSSGLVRVRIEGGKVAVGSVVDKGFGGSPDLDPRQFTPASRWDFTSLGLA